MELSAAKKDIILQLQQLAKRNGGEVATTMASRKLRTEANELFGSWGDACAAAGVARVARYCPDKRIKNLQETVEFVEPATLFDLSKGILVPPTNAPSSICFDCKRSAAPTDFRCSWDDHLELPEGAEYFTTFHNLRSAKYSIAPIIIKCPLFEYGRSPKLYKREDV